MEELANQYAKNATVTTLWAAIATAIVVVGVLAKLFKDWKEVVQAIGRALKGVGMIGKWIFRQATWQRWIENKIDAIEATLKTIKYEVQHNGGSSLKDRQVEIQMQLNETNLLINVLLAKLHISALSNHRMEFKMNKDAACTEINEVFLRHFGYAERDILGYGYENIVHEGDVLEMRSKWTRAIEQCSRFKDEQRIRNNNGEWISCCVQAFPMCQGKDLIEFVGFIEINKT